MTTTIYNNSNPEKVVEYKNISYIGGYHEIKTAVYKSNEYYANGYGIINTGSIIYFGTFIYNKEHGKSYFNEVSTLYTKNLKAVIEPGFDEEKIPYYRKLRIKKQKQE